MSYFRIYVLPALLVVIFGVVFINTTSWEYLPEQCGTTRFENVTKRIKNGERAELGQFPWIARIGYRDKFGGIWFFCGGAILNRFHVLSAAYCEAMGNIVRVGENYPEKDIDCDNFDDCAPRHQDLKFKRTMFQNMCFENHEHDKSIMLILLEKAMEFNDFVKPICLPKESKPVKDYMGKLGAIPGFGLENKRLMYFNGKVVDMKECDYKTDTKEAPLKSRICIGHTKETQEICDGDGGGPVSMVMSDDDDVRRAYVIGISYYKGRDCGKIPAVFIYIPYYIEWILDKIEK